MNQLNEIIQELQDISPLLARMQKLNVFEVPDRYFTGLAEKIAAHVLLNQNDILNFNKKNIQQVPEGYFDTLSEAILSKIKKEEAENNEEDFHTLFPVLQSLKDKNVFTVPENYFEGVSHQIIAKIKNRQPAKVISMKAKWWKYAAAAIITGVVAIGSLQLFNSHKNNNPIPSYVESSFQYKTPTQIDEGIASLSDDEIIKYLEKYGSIMDNDLLIKDVDVKELPATEDYLIDENTLNNYLEKIDVQSDNKTH
jgi:hypothetical protein